MTHSNSETMDNRLLIEIVHLYYNDGATQQEIADKMHISRSLVSKYLSKAKESGIVEITIHDDSIHPYRDLEKSVQNKFKLQEVICVAYEDNSIALRNRLGSAAARHLMRLSKSKHRIGISAGKTLLQMAKNISPYTRMNNVTFTPMVGGLGTEHNDIHAHIICDILATKTAATKLELYAPLLLDSAASRDVFMKQPFIKEVMQFAKQVDVAYVGIGKDPRRNSVMSYYFQQDVFNLDTIDDSVIGDVGYIFIDQDGQEVECAWNQRILALDLDDLKNIPLVAAVAGGRNKFAGILAAVRNGLIDVLITDAETAKKLSAFEEQEADNE